MRVDTSRLGGETGRSADRVSTPARANRDTPQLIRRRPVLFLLAATLLLTMVGIAGNAEQFELDTVDAPPPTNVAGASSSGNATDAPDLPQAPEAASSSPRAELPPWLLWVVGLPAAIGAVWLLAKQRISVRLARRRPGGDTASPPLDDQARAEAIADFADDLIGELELDVAPRLAIQRAYAAVETGFGQRELRRKPAETPLRYLDRIFGRRAAAGDPLERLTSLFQIARFSDEPVDESMRLDAIDSLRALRDQYRSLGRISRGSS